MKLPFFLLMLCIYTQTFSQNKDELQIRSILAIQTQAWNEGAIERFMQGYWNHDSLMFIGQSGITYGYQQTLNNYKKNYPDKATMGELTFSNLKLKRITGAIYFVVGKWFLARKEKGDVSGHFTLLWKKIKGAWVIVSDHSS